MNDYVQSNGPDSLDQAERDNARYEAEREQSDADWEQEREAKIVARAEEMVDEGDDYLKEALCSDEVVKFLRSYVEGDFYVQFATLMAGLIKEMAEEEVDKEYS